jgi:hypothetical protein
MEHRASSEIAKKSFVRSPAVAEESLRNGFQTLRRGDRVSYAGAIKWSTPSCSPTPNLQTSTPSCSPTPTCDGAATALVPRPVRHDDASLRPTGHEPPTDQRRGASQRQRTGQRTGRSVRRPRMRTPQRRRALGSLIGAHDGAAPKAGKKWGPGGGDQQSTSVQRPKRARLPLVSARLLSLCSRILGRLVGRAR